MYGARVQPATRRYALRSGEYLAVSPGVIHRDADGFFLILGSPDAPANETRGTVAIVHIRGALGHYKTDGGDSYEAIVDRVKLAIEAEEKPSAIVFRIESPGGVVAGLSDTVLKIRKLSKDSGVPFYAYVDEMAASAAYAITCGCEEVFAPPSAIIGSVGVISTMVSQAKKDAKDGVEFEIITSGARKADGHLHMPISDAAKAAERARNEELASQFFVLASEARDMSPKKLASLEAAIYLAADAKRVGLIDDVKSYDDLIAQLDETSTGEPEAVAPNTGNATDRRASARAAARGKKNALDGKAAEGSLVTYTRADSTHPEDAVSVQLKELITRTMAAIASASDPKQKTKLEKRLARYEQTKRMMAKDDPEDDDEGDEDDDEGEDDESKAAKAKAAEHKAAKKAEAAKHRAEAAKHKTKMAEYEEAAKKCEDEAASGEGDEDDDEKKASARAAALVATADLTPAAAAAIAAQSKLAEDAMRRLAVLEGSAAKREQSASIKEALADGRITPSEAKMLGAKTPQWSAEYIDTRKGVRVVNVDEGHLVVPDGAGDTPKAEMAEIDERIATLGLTDAKQIDKLRADMIANRRKVAMNGLPGQEPRY